MTDQCAHLAAYYWNRYADFVLATRSQREERFNLGVQYANYYQLSEGGLSMTDMDVTVDAWGTEGAPYECQECYGSGTTYGETCCTCGGFGFCCVETE